MSPLDHVELTALMQVTAGRADFAVAIIDGPVATDHVDFGAARMSTISGSVSGQCQHVDGAACQHGTFIAGILVAARGSTAPAICPDCSLLIRPIFTETASSRDQMPSAKPGDLAR